MTNRYRKLFPAILGGALCTVWVALLLWPMPIHLADWHMPSAFGNSHIWVFQNQSSALFSGELGDPGCAAGYPFSRHMRTIAWVPGLFFVPLQALFGAITSTHLLQLISLPVSGILAGLWFERHTRCSPWIAQAMGVAYALCPTHLSHLATGEISNTQGWIIPAWLLAMASRGSGWRVARNVALVTLAAAFTSPYLALALPLLAAGWLSGAIIGYPRTEWISRCGTRIHGSFATGLALIPAWFYFAQDRAGGTLSIFQPARRESIRVGELPHPPPIGTLDGLFWSAGGQPGSPYEPIHTTYLGIVLVLLALWSVGRARGVARQSGLALAFGGVLLTLGPALAIGGEVLALGLHTIPLPMALLETLHYPTGVGGLYYRYAVIVVFGLCVLGAAGLSRVPSGHRWVWLLLLVQLADAARGTPTNWPRESEPIAGAERLAALSGEDGAVLELPIQGPTDAWFGQAALLRATIHRRPTTALPRGIPHRFESVRGLWEAVMQAEDSNEARTSLSENGFRLVLLPMDMLEHTGYRLDEIEARLGPVENAQGLLIWDLGPSETPSQCVTMEVRTNGLSRSATSPAGG